MNTEIRWRRGLFRIWMLLSVIWIALSALSEGSRIRRISWSIATQPRLLSDEEAFGIAPTAQSPDKQSGHAADVRAGRPATEGLPGTVDAQGQAPEVNPFDALIVQDMAAASALKQSGDAANVREGKPAITDEQTKATPPKLLSDDEFFGTQPKHNGVVPNVRAGKLAITDDQTHATPRPQTATSGIDDWMPAASPPATRPMQKGVAANIGGGQPGTEDLPNAGVSQAAPISSLSEGARPAALSARPLGYEPIPIADAATQIAPLVIGPPFLLLVLGTAVLWVLAGFRRDTRG